jgi:hypothetical protein
MRNVVIATCMTLLRVRLPSQRYQLLLESVLTTHRDQPAYGSGPDTRAYDITVSASLVERHGHKPLAKNTDDLGASFVIPA